MKISRLLLRLGLDAVMALLFVFSLAFRITGRAPHEWTGLALCILFGIHTAVNWGWYRKLLKGRYTLRRTVNTATNFALLIAMSALCTSGILNSRHIFGFSQYVDGAGIRQAHSFAAYWGLVLMGIHTGLHWEKIAGVVRKAIGTKKESRAMVFVLYTFAWLIVACGIWASCDRDMGSKLFLGFSFDFWGPGRPLILFYACNLAIAGVYAFVAYHALRLAEKKTRQEKKKVSFDKV